MEKSFSYFHCCVRINQAWYYKNHNASFHSRSGRNMAAHCSTTVFLFTFRLFSALRQTEEEMAYFGRDAV